MVSVRNLRKAISKDVFIFDGFTILHLLVLAPAGYLLGPDFLFFVFNGLNTTISTALSGWVYNFVGVVFGVILSFLFAKIARDQFQRSVRVSVVLYAIAIFSFTVLLLDSLGVIRLFIYN